MDYKLSFVPSTRYNQMYYGNQIREILEQIAVASDTVMLKTVPFSQHVFDLFEDTGSFRTHLGQLYARGTLSNEEVREATKL